jgi:hypothetical protein
LELVLVLALLVIIGAIIYPSLDGMYGGYRLTVATDMVRGAWASARSHAMNEGQSYRFAVVQGKGNFRLAPDTADNWGSGSGAAGSPPPSTPAAAPSGGDHALPPLIMEDVLPTGVRFTTTDALQSGGPDVSGSSILERVEPGSYTTLVTFWSDGTADKDVTIAFHGRGGQPLVLQLRGLTGAVSLKEYSAEGRKP